jgi:hypothetical protein
MEAETLFYLEDGGAWSSEKCSILQTEAASSSEMLFYLEDGSSILLRNFALS